MDVRKLLRKKTQERKVNDPYARYNQQGRLHCELCALRLSLGNDRDVWSQHVASLRHRSAIANQPNEDEMIENRDRVPSMPETTAADIVPLTTFPIETTSSDSISTQKRRAEGDPSPDAKKQRISDPNYDDDDDDGDDGDDDWEAFSKDVASTENSTSIPPSIPSQVYENATISSEARMNDTNQTPSSTDDTQMSSIQDEDAFLRDRQEMQDREALDALDKFEALKNKMERLRRKRQERVKK